MKPLTLDALREILPEIDEIRPIFSRVLSTSRSPESDLWAASTALGTAGARRGRLVEVAHDLSAITRGEVDHLRAIHTCIGQLLEALADGDAEAAASALLEAAALEEARERSERARAYADAAVRTLSGNGGSFLGLRALRRRARASRSLGRYAEALADYTVAWQGSDQLGDAQGAAEAAIGAGNVLEDQARWEDAESWYQTALSGIDRDAHEGPERWQALLNLSVVLRSRGALEEAREQLDAAERAAEAFEGEGAGVFFENARGQWFMAAGQFEEAIDHLTLALASANDARARIIVGLNLAEALHASGRTLEAAEEARRAELEAINARRPDRLPEVYRTLGRLAADEGSPDAFVLFERALALIEEHALPPIERARTLQFYAEAETAAGRSDTAETLHAAATAAYEVMDIEPRATWAETHPGAQRKQ